MRTASSALCPAAMSAPNIAPALQPTTRSGARPSRINTSTMPRAAILRTPPLPSTMAKRGGAGWAEAGALVWTVSKFMGSLCVGMDVNATVPKLTCVRLHGTPRGA